MMKHLTINQHQENYSNAYAPVPADKQRILRKRPLDLSHEIISSPQDFFKTTFKYGLDCLLTEFLAPVNFRLTQYQQSANFSSALFHDKTDFTWSQYQHDAIFSHAQFRKTAYFYRSIFKQHSNFYKSHFYDKSDFSGTQFFNTADFSKVYFDKAVNFYNALFNSPLSFQGAVFKQAANFHNSVFQDDVDFSYARFGETLNLSHTRLKGHINFRESTLPKFLDLSHIDEIAHIIDLTEVIPNPNTQYTLINLVGTKPDNIRFRYHTFKLYFPKYTQQNTMNAVYEELLDSFNKNGYSNSYRSLYVEYMEQRYLHNNQWLLNLLQKYWWNYGLDKGRIFSWILLILLTLTTINNFFYDKLVKHAYRVPFLDNQQEKRDEKKHRIQQFFSRFPRTFVYTLILFFGSLMGFQRNVMEFKSKYVFVNIYLMLTITCGLMCAMFILNFFIYQR